MALPDGGAEWFADRPVKRCPILPPTRSEYALPDQHIAEYIFAAAGFFEREVEE